MPPPLRILAFRPRRPDVVAQSMVGMKRAARRTYAENNPGELPKAPKGDVGPNMEQAEHVSEEAAKMANIQGGEGPDMSQGTPVQDILREESETKEEAPQVLKDQVNKGDPGTQPSTTTGRTKRSFSTFARRRMELQSNYAASPPSFDPALLSTTLPTQNTTSQTQQPPKNPPTSAVAKPGHKFPLPPQPLPTHLQKAHRTDPVLDQVTNLLMRDGKKSVAQRNLATILTHLRTSPAPIYAPNRPLLPGAPAASHLPLNPILYLTLALDSVAPLLRIRSQRGAAGGGVALQIPVPLGARQRRRQAMTWILDAVEKKRSSGRGDFATRVAEEVRGIVEGKSGVWERRGAVHKLGTAARMNLGWRVRRR